MSQWQCAVCTYYNVGTAKSCAMCGNAKEYAPNSTINQRQWTCSSCTLINEPHALICNVCSTPKSTDSAHPIDGINDVNTSKPWNCPKCTLQNQPDAAQCAVCGHRPFADSESTASREPPRAAFEAVATIIAESNISSQPIFAELRSFFEVFLVICKHVDCELQLFTNFLVFQKQLSVVVILRS